MAAVASAHHVLMNATEHGLIANSSISPSSSHNLKGKSKVKTSHSKLAPSSGSPSHVANNDDDLKAGNDLLRLSQAAAVHRSTFIKTEESPPSSSRVPLHLSSLLPPSPSTMQSPPHIGSAVPPLSSFLAGSFAGAAPLATATTTSPSNNFMTSAAAAAAMTGAPFYPGYPPSQQGPYFNPFNFLPPGSVPPQGPAYYQPVYFPMQMSFPHPGMGFPAGMGAPLSPQQQQQQQMQLAAFQAQLSSVQNQQLQLQQHQQQQQLTRSPPTTPVTASTSLASSSAR